MQSTCTSSSASDPTLGVAGGKCGMFYCNVMLASNNSRA